jgi:hypothetical protein
MAAVFLAGCAHRNETSTTTVETIHRAPARTSEDAVVRNENNQLQLLGERIAGAPDAIAEAEAIRQLREYLVSHRLLYRTNTVRYADGTPVTGAPARNEQVRADVQILRGEQTISNFSFIPKDNHNLALLGTD